MTKTQIQTVLHGSLEYQAAVELRRRVLRRPLGLDFTEEELRAEEDQVHFVAADGKPIDVLAWGEPLRGLAVGTLDGRATLFLADAKGVSALRFTR